MRLISTIWLLQLFSTPLCLAEVIMDQLGMLMDGSYTTGNGNSIGGENLFGARYALQVADDFRTTETGFIITQITVANFKLTLAPVTDVRISFFQDLGGEPSEEPVFTARAMELGANVSNEFFDDPIFGAWGVFTTADGLHIELTPSTGYFVCMQSYSGADDWAYTDRSNRVTGADSFLRDGPTDEGIGGYGWTTWRSAADGGFGAGDSAYRIEATNRGECSGGERIAKTLCRQRNDVNKLTVKLADGVPGDAFSVELSTGASRTGTLDDEGRARVRFKRLPGGDGTATATWGCGARDDESYACP